jgi:hypothetical protein
MVNPSVYKDFPSIQPHQEGIQIPDLSPQHALSEHEHGKQVAPLQAALSLKLSPAGFVQPVHGRRVLYEVKFEHENGHGLLFPGYQMRLLRTPSWHFVEGLQVAARRAWMGNSLSFGRPHSQPPEH